MNMGVTINLLYGLNGRDIHYLGEARPQLSYMVQVRKHTQQSSKQPGSWILNKRGSFYTHHTILFIVFTPSNKGLV